MNPSWDGEVDFETADRNGWTVFYHQPAPVKGRLSGCRSRDSKTVLSWLKSKGLYDKAEKYRVVRKSTKTHINNCYAPNKQSRALGCYRCEYWYEYKPKPKLHSTIIIDENGKRSNVSLTVAQGREYQKLGYKVTAERKTDGSYVTVLTHPDYKKQEPENKKSPINGGSEGNDSRVDCDISCQLNKLFAQISPYMGYILMGLAALIIIPLILRIVR